MARLAWLGGLAAMVAFALLVAFRGEAAANDATSCTQVDGYLSFCLNVPLSGVRRETSVPLIALPAARADVRVETSVPAADATALTVDVDRSVERVQALFGHPFDPRPRVLLFGTSASFATAAGELFGYSAETSAYVASTYGGIFDRPTLTVALNWSASSPERMGAATRHELGHLMIRELARGRDVPAWLDEGIATLIEEDAPAAVHWGADEALVGYAVGSGRIASLGDLGRVSDFHAAYANVGRPLYAYVATAVRAMEARIGWRGVVATLEAIGAGTSADAAYAALSGESIAALEGRVRDGPALIVTAARANGVEWTLSSGLPNAETVVSISGGEGYEVTFTVRTDALGMYRGSFGGTAAPGVYTVRAAGAVATFSTVR